MSSRSSLRLALLVPMFMACCYFINDERPKRVETGYDSEQPCPCQDNVDCSSGNYCMRSLCRAVPPGARTCATANDCDRRSSCINGYCSEWCTRDLDCGSGGRCVQNYCTSAPSAVDAGTPPPDPIVDAGTPDAGTADAGAWTCTYNSDCGSGAYCINQVCYLGCHADADCPSSDQCVSGICKPRPPQQNACSSGADCPSGHDCVNGACRAPCGCDQDCATGESCQIGYCMPSQPSGSGQSCTVDCDCPSGQTCQAGTCQL
jgi:Cys-rich repeat protein